MNVLVDTAVWSLVLRRRPTDRSAEEQAVVSQLADLLDDDRAFEHRGLIGSGLVGLALGGLVFLPMHFLVAPLLHRGSKTGPAH